MNVRTHPSEFQVQMAVVTYLKIRARSGVCWFSCPNGGYVMDPRAVAKLKAAGLRPGIPDIVVLIAGEPTLGLELKTKGGRLSDAQKEMRDVWIAAGGQWEVATGVDEAVAALLKAGAIA
jgi:hypothetical protein